MKRRIVRKAQAGKSGWEYVNDVRAKKYHDTTRRTTERSRPYIPNLQIRRSRSNVLLDLP